MLSPARLMPSSRLSGYPLPPARHADRPGGLSYSTTSSKSFASTCRPGCTSTCVTFPPTGAYTVLCIFIASITSSRSPFFTTDATPPPRSKPRPEWARRSRPACAGSAFGRGGHLHLQTLVADLHFARLPVQFEKHRAVAFGMRLAHRQKLDHQRFARLQFHRDLVAASASRSRIAAWAAPPRCRTPAAPSANFRNTSGYIRKLSTSSGDGSCPILRPSVAAVSSKSTGGRCAPGRPALRLRAFQNHLLQALRPAAFGLAQRALEHLDHGCGQRQVVIRPEPLQLLARSCCGSPGRSPGRPPLCSTASP